MENINDFDYLVSLWKNYNNASLLLTKAMEGTANDVGEFAEKLICKYYNVKQLNASSKSADLITADGKLIQVKSRKIKSLKATSLNVIRSWDFNVLVVVLFSKDGNILKAIEIDSITAKKLSKRDSHQNGDVLTTSKELLENKNAKDITKSLQNILDGKDTNEYDINYVPEVDYPKETQKEILEDSPKVYSSDIHKKEKEKIERKINGWFLNKGHINSKILYAFISLYKQNNGTVTYEQLKKEANIPVPEFKRNFDQMKNISEKNHGKIFEQNGDRIYLWEKVENIIWERAKEYGV